MKPRPAKSRARLPLEQQVFVSILRTADVLGQEAEQLVRARGLTSAQYNVLRILRGAEPQGCACREIGERMISHDPDMTRLLDRLEKRSLIRRERQTDDRRVVKTRITPGGLELLKSLDRPVRNLHKRQFRHVLATPLKAIFEWLEEVRARAPNSRLTASKGIAQRDFSRETLRRNGYGKTRSD